MTERCCGWQIYSSDYILTAEVTQLNNLLGLSCWPPQFSLSLHVAVPTQPVLTHHLQRCSKVLPVGTNYSETSWNPPL